MNTAAVARIRDAVRDAGADAYVAYTPSNIRYVTGFGSYFVSEWWRMHGTVLAVVPADERDPVSLVVSDFEAPTARAVTAGARLHTYRLWVDLGTASELEASPTDDPLRPEQYDPDELSRALRDALGAVSTNSGRIATDLQFVTLPTAERIRACSGGSELVDLTDAVYRVRLRKQDWEVDRLRAGVELSEAGMSHAAQGLAPGMTAREVRLLYQAGVIEAAGKDERYAGFTDSWVLPTVGGQTSASYGATGDGLQAGDLVKFDCGATVDGYRSDGGRTFAFGEPRVEARRLYDVLRDAQEVARSRLRPGTPLREAYRGAMDYVHHNGYPSYNRGHVGHSIGIDTFHEEPPFIGATTSTLVEPGMVFAVEVPSYTPDIGAIMIEDLVLTTEDEPIVLHSLPHELTVI